MGEEEKYEELFHNISNGNMNETYANWQKLDNVEKNKFASLFLNEDEEKQKEILENVGINNEYFLCEVENFIENFQDNKDQITLEIKNGESVTSEEAIRLMQKDPSFSYKVNESLITLVKNGEESKAKEFLKEIGEIQPVTADILEKNIEVFLATERYDKKIKELDSYLEKGGNIEEFKEKILTPINKMNESGLLKEDVTQTMRNIADSSASIAKQLSESIPEVLDSLYKMEEEIGKKEIEVIKCLKNEIFNTFTNKDEKEIREKMILEKYKDLISSRRPGQNMVSFFEVFLGISGQKLK